MSSFRRMLLFLLSQGGSKTAPLVVRYSGGAVTLNAEGEGLKTQFTEIETEEGIETEVILNA